MDLFLSIRKKTVQLTLCLALILPTAVFSAKPFIVGNLMGQLGNQFFIIAAVTSLALEQNATPYFPDLRAHGHLFDIDINREMVFPHINNSHPPVKKIKYHYREPYYHYKRIKYHKSMQVTGYFQSEKYFIKHKQEIIDLFSPSQEIVNYLTDKYSDIIDSPNTVAIHVRSYLHEDPTQRVHITYDMAYYEAAMALFPEDAQFIVFSNRIEKCKKDFSHIKRNIRFIEGEMHVYDFYLMSMCKDHIISNSSFSWWAAYLNQNPNKVVVVPPFWFNPSYYANTKDLIPSDWTILHY
ncbi:MAG: alpha-1,2-fucosyltransferase [Chlamydiota bacterium]|nr:alpha-1,2-fucosyltransferase [Chlamydiota bacterium]